jgi:glucose-1-phosphate thymidylyltransferase
MAWLDTGSPSGMYKASQFVSAVQEMQGYYVACLEEIAWRRGYITREQLVALGEALKSTEYGQYIITIAKGNQ